ncbi:MAG: hypothetical protein R2810_06360 [Flavobacteriales bacterium]
MSRVDTLESGIRRDLHQFSRTASAPTTANWRRHVRDPGFGGHLRYKRRSWSVGATAVRSTFDTELNRNLQPYNQFEFNGRA